MDFSSPTDVADNLAIRSLIERYNTAVMNFDGDAWSSTWAEDASWTLPGAPTVSGRANILAAWQQAMSQFEFVGFFANAGPLTLSGDSAGGIWFQSETLIGKDGSKRRITGRYEDEYARGSQGWQFTSRNYHVLHVEEF